MNLFNSCLCINFGPNTDNYYVISEKLMKYYESGNMLALKEWIYKHCIDGIKLNK